MMKLIYLFLLLITVIASQDRASFSQDINEQDTATIEVLEEFSDVFENLEIEDDSEEDFFQLNDFKPRTKRLFNNIGFQSEEYFFEHHAQLYSPPDERV